MLETIKNPIRNNLQTRTYPLSFRIRVAMVIVAIISMGAVSAGYAWWTSRDSITSQSIHGPYCLALTDEDLASSLGEVKYATRTEYSEDDGHPPGFWACRVDGSNGVRVSVTVTSRASTSIPRSDVTLTVVEDQAAVPGAVVTEVPGSDAVVVTWSDEKGSVAGWYQGDSAVVLSTSGYIDPDLTQSTAEAFTQILLRRAPEMLTITGFTPTPTPQPS